MTDERLPFSSLGEFTLEGILGSGGFGTVYRARDAGGRPVALKVLAPHADSQEMLARFERESEIRIEHPNVVRVISAGRDQGVSFIAFELLEGMPLNVWLKDAPLDPATVVDVAKQICDGLTAAHERNIIHRDLKPGNVFLCHDGVVKILDFGIARPMSQAGPQLTMAGSVIGTPGYLAPEQAKGDVDIRPAADLWSLGVILYQALSGKNPFIRSTAVATILAVVLEDAPSLKKENDTVPSELEALVQRCLKKDADDRWPSAVAMREALEGMDLTAGEPTPPAPVPSMIPADEQRVVALLLAAEVHDLAALRAAVRDFGGELIPMLGGAVGIFGGHTYEGDEAVRAVQAALAARSATGYVAVASGRASGSGGMVSGDAVQAVERAVDAKLSGVAVDAALARTLESQFVVRRISPHVVEVPKQRSGYDTGRFASVRDDIPLLSREAEVDDLESAIKSAFDASMATAAWISGPPGIGKSRLRSEVERRLRDREITTLFGRGEPHRKGAAYHVLSAALRSEPSLEPFFLNPGVSTERRRRALASFLSRTLADEVWAKRSTEPLARLLGLSDEQETMPSRRHSDPQLMEDRVRVALGDVLGAIAQRNGLGLVLDDAQWADEASLTLLEELLVRFERERLLVAIASRPELDDARASLFEAAPRLVKVHPRGLDRGDVATLAMAIAGREVSRGIVDEVYGRTEGNPFFVEQIVRELAEQNLLDRRISELPIPLDVEGAVQSRLDHLPTEEKQLCKRASILGSRFDTPSLRALEQPEPDRHLDALTRRGLVGARLGAPADTPSVEAGREYRFLNSMVAEVAYRMNTDDARRSLHRLAAEYLEASPDVDPEDRARHWELGEDADKAARAYAQAAFSAAKRGDNRSVLRCTERAFALSPTPERAFDLHIVRADALFFLGEKAAQRESIEAALVLASTGLQRARALVEKGALLLAVGESDEGLRVAEEAVAAARDAGDPDLLALALARLGWGYLYAGRISDASVPIAEASSIPHPSKETAAMVAAWRGQLFTALGDLGKRKAALEDAIAGFRETGDLRRAATSECNLADTYNRVGAYEEAEAALRKAIDSCQRVGNRVVEGYALANLGYALAGQGRIAEAHAAFDAALGLAEQLSRPRLGLAARLYRARADLGVQLAFELADDARQIAEDAAAQSLPALQASALALASRAALLGDDEVAALADAERAMQLRDEIGTMEEDEAEIFLALAEALARSGQAERAREIVARGASRLEFLAGRIEDADWRAKFLSEVPINRRLIELDGEAS
ncbi:MAG: serine/threonine-protein kinase PknK [Sandaracinaceae bacterium]